MVDAAVSDRSAAGTRALSDVYRQLKPTAYGAMLLALCVLVGMVEGYDVQAMSLAAPILAREWHLAPQAVGGLLATSLIGQAAGGFLLAPLGDKLGRRQALLIGLLIAGASTFGGAFAPNVQAMLAVRFVAGLGLGLALANTLALAMELTPIAWRTMAVVMVSSGYPLGVAGGAAIASQFLPAHGAAAIFYVGGLSTLVVLVLCLIALPESPVMLARRDDQAGLRGLLAKLGVPADPDVRIVGQPVAVDRSKVAALFAPERRASTILLWILMFANLSLVFFFTMWLPSLFVHSGLEPAQAIRATALFNFSGIAGGMVFATALPRIGPIRTLGVCYAGTLVAVGLLASSNPAEGNLYLLLFCCGFLIIGSQFCLNAVVNLVYPGPIRTTGAGYATGAGRIGGIIAPIVGGIAVAHAPSAQATFYVALVPAAISLIAVLSLRRLKLVGLSSE